MQQGGAGGSQSQYGEMSGPTTTATAAATALASTHTVLGGSDQSQQQFVEAASPISSRPPASGNFDELLRLSGSTGGGDVDVLADVAAAGDEGDRAGVSSGNRWPRQETLALLKIRSDMDAAFRDATVKGPLWEDVSRKLAELGYRRSAKKCKEKFENVHKYYKRTKEGRAGRQDGKSYKFFSQLEALHSTATVTSTNVSTPVMPVSPVSPATTLDVAPVSVGIPMPVQSSTRILPNPSQPPSTTPPVLMMPQAAPGSTPTPAPAPPFGISFSSNSSSSSSHGSEDDYDNEDYDELRGEPSNAAGTSRKRKRQSSRGNGSNTRRMMQFFEGLMKQVMQKQEAMQQRFLEAIEKREQDRMIREEAWKRQEMARLTREHELMAQERNIVASRDAAIISFLQKFTGQTVQLPTPVTVPTAPPPPTQLVSVGVSALAVPPYLQPSLPPQQMQQQQQLQQSQQQQAHHQPRPLSTEVAVQQSPVPSEVLMAIPEQQVPPQEIGGIGGSEPTSSRWPKAEVLALIKLRSGLESRYQEAGPKGPLWEEISAGMLRIGYKRSAKRCKEKWENINKYFKKVKESNKKRPEDAKTCPYFHQLDALYRKKMLGSTSTGGGGASTTSSFGSQHRGDERTSEQHAPESVLPAAKPQDRIDASAIMTAPQLTQDTETENKNGASTGTQIRSKEGSSGSLFGEGNGGAMKKPEDIVRELMEQQGMHQQQHQQGQQLLVDDYDKIDEPDSDSIDHEDDEDQNEEEEEEEEDGDDDDDDEMEEESKMAYKIEFQRQNTSASNGGGNAAPSFLAMVQ